MSAVEEIDQERRITFCLYEYWEKLAGGAGLPALKNMQKSEIELFKKNLVLLDLRAPNDLPTFQVIGQDLTEDLDEDLVGQPVSEVPRRTMLSRVTDHYQEVLANRVPIAFEAEFVNRDGEKALYRGILLPFSDDNNQINFIMGGVRWILEKDVTLDESKPSIEELMRTIAQGREDQPATIQDEQIAAEHQGFEDANEDDELETIETVFGETVTDESNHTTSAEQGDVELDSDALELSEEAPSEDVIEVTENLESELLEEEESTEQVLAENDDVDITEETDALILEAPQDEIELVDELEFDIEEKSEDENELSLVDSLSVSDDIEPELTNTEEPPTEKLVTDIENEIEGQSYEDVQNDAAASFKEIIEKELSGETPVNAEQEQLINSLNMNLGDHNEVTLEDNSEDELLVSEDLTDDEFNIEVNDAQSADNRETFDPVENSDASEDDSPSISHTTLEGLLASDNVAEKDNFDSSHETNVNELEVESTNDIAVEEIESSLDATSNTIADEEKADVPEQSDNALTLDEDALAEDDEVSFVPDESIRAVRAYPESNDLTDELNETVEVEIAPTDDSAEVFEVDDEDDLSIEQLMQSIIKDRKFDIPPESENQNEKNSFLDNNSNDDTVEAAIDTFDENKVEKQSDDLLIAPQEPAPEVITFEPVAEDDARESEEDAHQADNSDTIQGDSQVVPEIIDEEILNESTADQEVAAVDPTIEFTPEAEQVIEEKPKRANVIERAMEKMFSTQPFVKHDTSENVSETQASLDTGSTTSDEEALDSAASNIESDTSPEISAVVHEVSETDDVSGNTEILEDGDINDVTDFLELDEVEAFDEEFVGELMDSSNQVIEETDLETDTPSLSQSELLTSSSDAAEELSIEENELENEDDEGDSQENDSDEGPINSDAEELSLPELRTSLRQIIGYIKKEDANHNRSRDSLYNILTAIYEFHGTCEKSPEAFKQIVSEHELKIQERAPFTPVLKICLGKDYDKTRLTEYAAALGIAEYMNVDISEFHAFIKNFPGGIKGCVKEMRAIRKHGASGNITARKTRSVEEAREILREMEPIASFRLKKVIVGNNVDEFCLLLAKRDGHNIDVLKILDDKHTKLDPILKRTAFLKGNINDRK